MQILDEPLYNELRTEQQLGYSVSLSPTSTAGLLGLLVAVTSDRTPQFVEAAIERFLADAVRTLEALTAPQFEQHAASLAMLRLEPFKNVSELAEEHWASAWRCTYDFHDRYEVRTLLPAASLRACFLARVSAWLNACADRGGVPALQLGPCATLSDGRALVHLQARLRAIPKPAKQTAHAMLQSVMSCGSESDRAARIATADV